MKRSRSALFIIVLSVVLAVPAAFAADDMAKKVDAVLGAAPDNAWQVLADDVLARIKSGKKDFVVVDIRVPKTEKYDKGHIPGAVPIAWKTLAQPANLAKLPKDKDIILVCDTGHLQNIAVMSLRLLGYKAYNMKWGMMSWQKDYGPGMKTKEAIDAAGVKNYPIEK